MNTLNISSKLRGLCDSSEAGVKNKLDRITGLIGLTGWGQIRNLDFPVKFVSSIVFYQRLIKEFKASPGKFELKTSPKIPDGSPIGTDVCSYNTNK